MASLSLRKSLPAGATLVRAWNAMPPTLCGSKVEPVVPVAKPLPSEAPAPEASDAAAQQQAVSRSVPEKSFKMHIGASLHIPTKNAKERLQYSQPAVAQKQQGIYDPFEGLPLRGFAEKLGERVLPSIEAARAAEKEAKRVAKLAGAEQEIEVVVPEVPHVLPFTRWAANSQQFRSTFIADPPKERKKARLSWYHPDDTMVPRDWFRGGLMADLKYFNPFGLGKGDSATA